MAVKKAAKMPIKKSVRKVNREGQWWTDDRPGMTLRLPVDLREAITEESRVKGDLAKIVLFALGHVDRENVEIMQTRKAGMELSNPQIAHKAHKIPLPNPSAPRLNPQRALEEVVTAIGNAPFSG